MRRYLLLLIFALSFCLTTAAEARKLALLVGVDDYESIQPLRSCVNDMNTLKEALMKIGFEENNIQILVTGGAFRNYPIKKNIEKKLSEILSSVERGDMVFIAFSGHGVQVGSKIYFCPADTDTKNLDKTCVSITKVMNELAQSKARFKWVIIDACRNDSVSSRDVRGLQIVPAPPASTGIALFQSCAEGEKSYEERDGGNGYFTKNFAAALSGEADSDNNGKLTLMEVCNWTTDHTKKDVMKAEKQVQRPYLSGSVTNFIISKNIKVIKANALVEEARKAEKEKDYEQAIIKYNEAIKLCPNNYSWKIKLESLQPVIVKRFCINVPQDYATIAEAYNHVTDNGVITIQPGKYELSETIVVTRSVTFKGNSENAEDVVIDCPSSHPFQITGGSPSFQNLTVISSAKRCYSFFITDGSPKLFNCIVTSREMDGICILGEKTDSLFESCIIKDCGSSGAEITENALASFKNCEIFGNERMGITTYKSGNLTLTECKVHENKLFGVTIFDNSVGILSDCDIYENEKSGISICESANSTVTGCKIHENKQCGVCFSDKGHGAFRDCIIYGNTQDGIAMIESADPTFTECKIYDNKLFGVSSDNSNGTFKSCEIYGNELTGVMLESYGYTNLSNCKIHDNKQAGVAILKKGRGAFDDNEIYKNEMSGIHVQSSAAPSVCRCKIYDGKQCGIYISDNGEGHYEDCEIYGNAVAGIEVETAGDPIVERCKIHDNKQVGVYIHNGGSGMYINNTLKDNSSNSDPYDWSVNYGSVKVLGGGNTPPIPGKERK